MASQNPAANETDEHEEPVISMVDYLREEEELQNDADAVLGDSDEDLCTYPLGYKSRQAVYACATCTPTDKEPAGICLACSYACHEGHDLLELYTKRNFCCDCGNAKFSKKCELFPTKRDYNTENQYNHNFKGVYCICARPYPDPDDDIEDEMIQCVVCEDWYHFRHLGGNQPIDNFQEMICPGCMEKHPFLWAYTVYTEETQKLKMGSSSSVDIETVKEDANPEDSEQKKEESSKSTEESKSQGDARTAEAEEKTEEVSKSTEESKSPEEGKSTETAEKKDEVLKPTEDSKSQSDEGQDKEGGEQCHLEELRKRKVVEGHTATYWLNGFRAKLCRCHKCKAMYAEQKIEFLTDQSDTVHAYESRGAAKRRPQEDKEQQALAGMSRVQQIEMVQGFNDMKSELSEYLKKFAENGKVVRSEDIQEFFQQMHARKRQKTDHTPSYFCR